jgi:phospholipid transport system transporter-binding protein
LVSAGFESVGEGRYRVSGPLVFGTVPAVWRQSREALQQATDAVIDLAGVTEVDSAGLALAIEWLRWAKSKGGKISITGLPEGLAALARISEVDDFLVESGSHG